MTHQDEFWVGLMATVITTNQTKPLGEQPTGETKANVISMMNRLIAGATAQAGSPFDGPLITAFAEAYPSPACIVN